MKFKMNVETCFQRVLWVNKHADFEFRIKKLSYEYLLLFFCQKSSTKW